MNAEDDPGLEGLTVCVRERHGEGSGWAPPYVPEWQLQPGDRYTIAGVYRRRTWWEWLTFAPRPLQVWYVRKAQS
jgi:hypothetical protein